MNIANEQVSAPANPLASFMLAMNVGGKVMGYINRF